MNVVLHLLVSANSHQTSDPYTADRKQTISYMQAFSDERPASPVSKELFDFVTNVKPDILFIDKGPRLLYVRPNNAYGLYESIIASKC